MELRNFRGLSDSVLASLEVSNVPHLSHLNSEDFRSVGNSYYKKDQFCQAVIVYSKGLVFNPKSAVLLTNRAQTFLKVRKIEIKSFVLK